MPRALTLCHVARDGRLLLTRDDERQSIVCQPPGETTERELSSFYNSAIADLSPDCRQLLFCYRCFIYIRSTDGAPASRVATEGFADDLSPDGRTILVTSYSRRQLSTDPDSTRANRRRSAPHDIELYGGALWFPDGQRILITGQESGRVPRSYIQDRETAVRRGHSHLKERERSLYRQMDSALPPSARRMPFLLWPVDGGASHVVPGSEPGDRPVGMEC